MKKLKDGFLKILPLWPCTYFLVYLLVFKLLETRITGSFMVIHMDVDEYIPFCEYFIIPYLLWFPMIGVSVGYFFLKEREEYKRLLAFLFTGMTLFLVISAVIPNGHIMRPVFFEHDNIFTALVKNLYAADTETNVFPSIHVYNSVAVCCVVYHSQTLKKKRVVKALTMLLTVLIILATLFLKQHSVADDLGAFLMAAVVYRFVYEPALCPFKETANAQFKRAA